MKIKTDLRFGQHKIMILFKYSKTCFKQPLKKRTKLVFKTNYRLMQVKSIAECSKGSVLQYFRPSLGYHVITIFVLSIFERLHKTSFTIIGLEIQFLVGVFINCHMFVCEQRRLWRDFVGSHASLSIHC